MLLLLTGGQMTPVNQHLQLCPCAGNQFVCLVRVAEQDPDPAHVGAAQNTGYHEMLPFTSSPHCWVQPLFCPRSLLRATVLLHHLHGILI